MRIHRLRLTAFGPFPGTEEVDLDALAEGGLFLLHGPTGAGKTSVLDAVCYALYGRVPGSRDGARLRSDHADPGLAPEVVCEFSMGSRRLQVTRSPAWERPKKRGAGTTTEPARVLVRELQDGDWRPLTTRIDESAHLLEGILGLGLDQFTKLVLLPQGDFAAFLRADAEVRRAMLERLFVTDRFTAVQQWVREHQVAVRREVDAATVRTQVLLAQAEQAATVLPQLPPAGTTDPREDGAGEPVPADDPAAAVAALRRRAREAWEDATARRGSTQTALRSAVVTREKAEPIARRRQEFATASARRDALIAQASAQQVRRARLDRARRASALVPLGEPLAAARDRLAAATQRLDRAGARVVRQAGRLGTELAEPGPEPAGLLAVLTGPGPAADLGDREVLADQEVQEALDHLAMLSAQVAAASADEEALDRADAEVAAQTRLAAEAMQRDTEAREQLASATAAADSLRQRRHELAALTGTLPAAREDVRVARDVVATVAARDELATQVALAVRQRDDARALRDDARERWLDVRRRRLDQMAAELAARLTAGHPCPVCGSAEHPDPAQPSGASDGRADAAAEDDARAVAEAAQAHLDRLDQALAAAQARLAALTASAGGLDTAAARARLATAEAAVRTAEDATTEDATAAHRQTALDDDLARWSAQREAAEQGLRACGAAFAAAAERAGALRARVAAARGGHATLATRLAELRRATGALEELVAARVAADAAGIAEAETARAASLAAGQAGFDDVDTALAAVLAADVIADLQATCRDYDDDLAAVTDRLRDPDLAAAAATDPPPLAALVAAEEIARDADEAAARLVAVSETAATAIDRIAADLAAHLRAVEPLMQRHRTVSDLARCLDGTGGENARRMSLSAYVLAARLEQVAEAAGVRLAAMSGGRYTLVHSDDLQRGRGRSGLALRVVDGWTGLERDTASLSGGESFYTALALALGLADVVAAEAGGAVVDTLFVDEGFGSLDDQALEEVMDVLDGLRSGGRAVGLVSHVPGLRDRIPSRLEVVKTRTGSRLRQATA